MFQSQTPSREDEEPHRAESAGRAGWPISLDLCLPPDDQAPGVARHTLAGLEPYVPAELRDTACLLVSELVTNSVLHAGLRPEQCINIHLSSDGVRLRVVVHDPGSGQLPDAPDAPPIGHVGGWGLMLVDRLADRWGTETFGSTQVWFELVAKDRGTRPSPR